MNAVSKIRFKIEEIFVVAILGALVLLVFGAAALRWVGISIVWSVDLAQLLLTWLCFIGADLAYSKNKHMGVDLLKNLFSERVRIFLNILINIIFIVFMFSILYYGFILSENNYVRKFNALPISYSVATISAPGGAFLMILTGIEKIIRDIRILVGKDKVLEEEQQIGGYI